MHSYFAERGKTAVQGNEARGKVETNFDPWGEATFSDSATGDTLTTPKLLEAIRK